MLCPWESAEEVRRPAMSTQRKQYSAEFKARVALEALKGLKTVNE
jgi:transposase-like protein